MGIPQNMKYVLLFIFIIPLSFNAQYKYKKVENAIAQKFNKKSEYTSVKKQYFDKAADLTSYLPKNFSKKGDIDYTQFLQKGLNENLVILLPDFPVLINFNGLRLRSNSSLLFQECSKLILKPNSEELYGLLYIENVDNVKVYFANLVGDRDNHNSKKGEWGMGIFIRSSINVKIYNPRISKMWGDGIYIGSLAEPSQNIVVDYAILDENRRNGISIISGSSITVTNSLISNTNGTIPEYGIDIEPNKPEDILKHIILSNNITYNNSKGGLLFALDNLQGKNSDPVEIKINNFTDYYSDKGIEFHVDRGYRKYTNPLRGTISITGANLNYNKTPLINNESKAAQIELNLTNINNNNIRLRPKDLNQFKEKFRKGLLQISK